MGTADLINSDGSQKVKFAQISRVPMMADAVTADGDGVARRQVAIVHRAAKRRYRLVVVNGTGAELAAVQGAWKAVRGGAGVSKWLHPLDDAVVALSAAPDWRMLACTFARGNAGVVWNGSIEIEEL